MKCLFNTPKKLKSQQKVIEAAREMGGVGIVPQAHRGMTVTSVKGEGVQLIQLSKLPLAPRERVEVRGLRRALLIR